MTLNDFETFPLNQPIRQKVSVVIPTLGGIFLTKTIQILNSGSTIPDEIIVCIPEGHGENIVDIQASNVRILITKIKGQVSQRLEGFRAAKNSLVMQLDDDIILEERCLENLIVMIQSFEGKVALSPSLRFIETNKSVYSNRINFIKWTYYLIINGFKGHKLGIVTKSGTEIGVDLSGTELNSYEVEWLPGGCIIHRKENLIWNNFYPNSGKAFCEDLFHSRCLRENGVKLILSSDAIVWISDPRIERSTLFDLFHSIRGDFKARKIYVISDNKAELLRMYIYYCILIPIKIIKFIIIKKWS
jgi:GT2 family glycosyltransferase